MKRSSVVLSQQQTSICSESSPQTQVAEALWISISPSLGVFDQPLQRALTRQVPLAKWQYAQGPDESCEIAKAVKLLEEYMQTVAQPLHLLGHGLGGAVALLYARQHPEKVKSLTLMAVAEQPAVTWHAHYHVQRHLTPCSQIRVLAQLASSLFRELPYSASQLVEVLRQDLEKVPLLHSACHLESLPQAGVEVPLMVCGAEDDAVVHATALVDWSRWLKPGDRQCLCPDGGHFFHYSRKDWLAPEILSFWQAHSSESLEPQSSDLNAPSP